MVLESLGCNGLVLSSLCQEQQELVLRYVGNRNRCIFHFLAVSGYLQVDVPEQVPGFERLRVNRQSLKPATTEVDGELLPANVL